jgi:hypothetical protein
MAILDRKVGKMINSSIELQSVTKKPSNIEKMAAGGILTTTGIKEIEGEQRVVKKSSDMNVGSSI